MPSSVITPNDMMDKLCEDNRRLVTQLLSAKKCLKVHNQYKSFIDFISIQFVNHLESEVWKKFEDLSQEVDRVCGDNRLSDDDLVCMTTEELLEEPKQNMLKKMANTGQRTYSPVIETKSEEQSKDIGAKQEPQESKCNAIPREVSLKEKSPEEESLKEESAKDMPSEEMVVDENGQCGQRLNYARMAKSSVRPPLADRNNRELIRCPFNRCFKSVSKQCLKRHMFLCHSEKKFVCHYTGCQYKSALKHQLDTHLLRHSSDRNYWCHYSECDRKFKVKGDLNRHMKKIHPIPDPKLDN